MFFASRARLASWHPPMQRRRNLENSAVPTLLARGSRLAFRATMCRAEGDLEACWNRILTIFDPYTFSHSQGQGLSSSTGANRLNPCLLYLRFQACQWWSGRITLCATCGLMRRSKTTFANRIDLNRLVGVGECPVARPDIADQAARVAS